MTTLKDGYIIDGMNEIERNIKRLIDFCIAIVCLIVFSPLMIWCYVKVKKEDGGPHEDDVRMTKTGRFLRDHHLDELPQIWNVIKGEMSFIGPRPERKFYIDKIMEHDPRYAYLYQIRPGVTSYATIHNGYTDTMEKMLRRLELDLYYLEHRSLWLDAKLLLQTFLNIAFGKKF